MLMDDLHRALGDISNIRRQMARTTEFRGYGPATLASTSVFALLAAGVQARWVPDPVSNINLYLNGRSLGRLDYHPDRYARTPHALGYGRRNDPNGRRAVPSVRWGRCFPDDRARALCSVGSVDASRSLAGNLQPWHLLFLPIPSAANGRRGCVVFDHGIDLHIAGGTSSVFTLGNGDSICHRTDAC